MAMLTLSNPPTQGPPILDISTIHITFYCITMSSSLRPVLLIQIAVGRHMLMRGDTSTLLCTVQPNTFFYLGFSLSAYFSFYVHYSLGRYSNSSL